MSETMNGRRVEIRQPRGEHRRRLRWPRVIIDIATAAAEGSHAVAEAGIRAARPLLAADVAVVVRWQDGHPVVLAASGDVDGMLVRRPPEGAGWVDGRPVAAVSVDPRTDVVVARSAPIGFEEADVESLRALGELINWAGGARRPDALLRGCVARVVASIEPDEVLARTADAVVQLLRAEIAGVLLRDATGEYLEMRQAIGHTERGTAQLRIRAGQGLAGRVMESARPERIDDYSTDPRSAPEFMALSDIEGTCSAVAVPMRRDGTVIGVLCAWRRRREPFTEEDELLFAAFADLCGAAIVNAGKHQAQGRRAERIEAAHAVVAEQHRAAERDLHMHAELTRIAREGGDVDAVVRTVGRLTDSVAVVVTEDGRTLGSSSGSGASIGRLVAGVASFADGSREPVASEQEDGSWLLVAPVRAAGVTFGHLALVLDVAPTAGDRLAAEQAAVVCALLLARQEAVVAAARRLQSEFVWDLLDGRLPDSVEASVRARHLGSGFALPARVAAIMVHGLAYDATAPGANPEHLERARGACARLISEALEVAGASGAVLARRANLFAAVAPCGSGETTVSARRLAGALAAIRWPGGMSAAVGVGGRLEHISGCPAGWREAQLARSAAMADEPGVFEDLGVLQFLLAPTSREDLDGFARRQLGPLLDYDAKRGTQLARTLDVYLRAGCSTRRTAQLMCIHHRTVAYRMQRVGDLTGMCLDDQEDRFRVQLACKILALGERGAEV